MSKDKTPYKNHQGAFVACGPATGWYVEVAAPGVRVGVGFYEAAAAPLARLREAMASDVTGAELQRILTRLTKRGWSLGGEKLKTTPRGYAATHPRIDLLRHRSMTLGKSYGFEPVVHTAELADLVRRDWREARPFVEWVTRHAA